MENFDYRYYHYCYYIVNLSLVTHYYHYPYYQLFININSLVIKDECDMTGVTGPWEQLRGVHPWIFWGWGGGGGVVSNPSQEIVPM